MSTHAYTYTILLCFPQAGESLRRNKEPLKLLEEEKNLQDFMLS